MRLFISLLLSVVLCDNNIKSEANINYKRIHDEIINNAINRGVVIGQYKEDHHIVPKSMGGSDCKSNIVQLTAREHFIVHWLLKNIHKNKPMTYAFFSMTKMGNSSQDRYTSHSFKYARKNMAKMMSQRVGDKHPLYGIRGENNPNFGSKRSEENKINMSKAAKGIRVGEGNHKSRKVKNLTTGEIFGSIRQAQLKTTGNVSYSVRTGGTANGDRYCYLDKNNKPIDSDYKLKGYAKGKEHVLSVRVLNVTTGEVFVSIGEAARSINKSSTAVRMSMDNKRPLCGFEFKRVSADV